MIKSPQESGGTRVGPNSVQRQVKQIKIVACAFGILSVTLAIGSFVLWGQLQRAKVTPAISQGNAGLLSEELSHVHPLMIQLFSDGTLNVSRHRPLLNWLIDVNERFLLASDEDPQFLAACAIARRRMGECFDLVEMKKKAESAYQASIQTFAKIETDQDPMLRHQIARSIYRLADIRMSVGRTEDAIASYQEVIREMIELIKEQPSSHEFWVMLLLAYNQLQHVLFHNEHLAEVVIINRRVLELVESSISQMPDSLNSLSILGAAHFNLCVVLKRNGDLLGAQAAYKKSGNVFKRALEVGGVPFLERVKLAECQVFYISLLDELGRDREAQEELIALDRIVSGLKEAMPDAVALSQSLNEIGVELRTIHRHEEAERFFKHSIDALRDIRNSEIKSLLGVVTHNLAECLRLQDRFAEACDQYMRAVEHQAAALETRPGNAECKKLLANHWTMLGFTHYSTNEFDSAVKACENSLRLRATENAVEMVAHLT
ncbi:MAG: tetratricopeptide repeat protein, partial [Planctomycetes bacterium]|nr:tetratricopeptide repeat protein [Planctomycetota bacterium]